MGWPSLVAGIPMDIQRLLSLRIKSPKLQPWLST
jgi:hypothetical protein